YTVWSICSLYTTYTPDIHLLSLHDALPISLQAVPEAGLTADIMDVISSGKEGLEKLESYIKRLDLTDADFLLDEKDVAWGPAVSRPRKIICVGLNYRKHADETKAKYP